MDAAGEDASPLEFLLRLMRDDNVPVADRLNAAAEAAQYVVTRPGRAAPNRDALVHVVEHGPHGFGAGAVAQFMRQWRRTVAGTNVTEPEIDEAASERSPLAFMLQVMRDPEVPPQVRFRAVKLAARYSHAKQSAAVDEPVVGGDGRPIPILDNRWGFKVPPELAIKFWRPPKDVDSFLCKMEPISDEEKAEEKKEMARARADFLAGKEPTVPTRPTPRERASRPFGPAADVELPDGYVFSSHEAKLLRTLEIFRKEPPVPAREFAEAHLRVRQAVYFREASKAPLRIEELDEKLRQHPDPDLQRERDELARRFSVLTDKEFLEQLKKVWTMYRL